LIDFFESSHFAQVTLMPTSTIRSRQPWIDLSLSLATPPVLLMAIGSQVLGRSLVTISRLSEDLLRGERLPLLHSPSCGAKSPDDEAEKDHPKPLQ
jgi:hypothetical protein